MFVALIARDKPGALEIRKANRDRHLAYIEETGKVVQAGPLIVDGDMAGSLVILEVADLAEAEDWAANDPYKHAGLFGDVELIEWKKVIG
ncbi:YciI family protein [Litorisediminicola beolgyonensis]|uniref:YciI family protein n=1 Tax=Litorisediminicola beolgyonensis TaxID=1173614 RepID=A0ABW3ZHJ6_9RHOB